jgi:hypothetical protein
MKKINEIFSDYTSDGNINTAVVEAVVLRKKTKTLEMKISSDKYIEIKEFEYLNKFIRKRFALEDSVITVNYADGTNKKPIEDEMKNIVFSIAHKYPALKAVLLNSCEYEVDNNNINFNFKIAVTEFLKTMDYDKKIQKAIKDLYGTDYKINFADKLSSKELARLKEDKHENEMLLIQKEISNISNNNAPKPSMEAAEKKQEVKAETDGKKGNSSLILGRSANIKEPIIKITDITPDEGKVAIEGEISNIDTKELKSGKILISFDLYDGSSSMTCKAFLKPGEDIEVLSRLKKAKGVRLSGNSGYSKFSQEIEIIANTIIETEGRKKSKRQDKAEVKRVELHMHTQMSQMDAMTSATDLIKRAMSWEMKSIALTDHGVVQAFPEAHKLLGRDNPDMKILYGVEAYLAPDKKPSVTNDKGQNIDTTYCVLDLETTGFSPVTEKITEIGIMKVKDGKANHTVMSEALEVWPEDIFRMRLPRIYQIVCEINRRLVEHLYALYPGDVGKVDYMAIIAHGYIHMANLCVSACFSVNGVSSIHSAIVKNELFADYGRLCPEKFTNVTNGIAHRRWLCQSNPELSGLITELIGSGFVMDASELAKLKKYENDRTVLDRLAEIKLHNKQRLAKYIKSAAGITVDPDSIFDMQVKRLHEYKRQTLNILHVLSLWQALRENPDMEMAPQTFIFGAKAAPGYFMAKQIIRLICCAAKAIDADPAVRGRLKVVFLEDYRVTLAELLMPAAEISEQISLAGTEASGTGNMKLMINGAVTLGTLDGANIEMREAVGNDNIIIFGLKAEEVENLKRSGYSPTRIYQDDTKLRSLMNLLNSGIGGVTFRELEESLIGFGNSSPDRFMVFEDFESYCAAHDDALRRYADPVLWNRMSLRNIAGAGYFSSDRAVTEYAQNIWHIDRI